MEEGEISEISGIGRKTGKRPIKMRLLNFQSKQKIFQNISNFKGKNIFFTNDLSKDQREKYKKKREEIKAVCELLKSSGL